MPTWTPETPGHDFGSSSDSSQFLEVSIIAPFLGQQWPPTLAFWNLQEHSLDLVRMIRSWLGALKLHLFALVGRSASSARLFFALPEVLVNKLMSLCKLTHIKFCFLYFTITITYLFFICQLTFMYSAVFFQWCCSTCCFVSDEYSYGHKDSNGY